MEARDAIAAKTALNVPELVQSKVHGGQFSLQDLFQEVKLSPCALTSCIGINGVEIAGNVPIIDANWAMVLVARDELPTPRSSVSLSLTTKVLKFLALEDWDYEGFVSLPTDVRGRNLDTPQHEKNMVSMFAITWRQKVEAGEQDNPDDLEDLESVHIDYFLEGLGDLTSDAEDLIVYP